MSGYHCWLYLVLLPFSYILLITIYYICLAFKMSLSKTREKRANAGNRMAKLLDAEDEDEFYKTTYGGFDDVGKLHCFVILEIVFA